MKCLNEKEKHSENVLIEFIKKRRTMSYRNDNIIIKDKDGAIKYQTSCYRLFAIFVIGNISITSGLIMRAKKFGYFICLVTSNLRVYQIIGSGVEGNTYLHTRQYSYAGLEIGNYLVWNKILNQRQALNRIRRKTVAHKESITKLDGYLTQLKENPKEELQSLLGIEGSASRVYFSQLFSDCCWKGRKPRVKQDYINTVLDMGYTMLFNFIDVLLQLYGFDVYYGVLHRCFYMRKSLVCDIMEPFRPIIDCKVRKAIRLGQCKESDFNIYQHQWVLKKEKLPDYMQFLAEAILERKMEIFYFVQSYYRCFMKGKEIEKYPVFQLEKEKK